MPPKAPKAKPRLIPRPGSGARAPEAVPGPTISAAPPANPAEVIQTHAPIAPPAGRLDSLIPPSARASGVLVPLKFKPKVVPRKSKEEREALDAKFEVVPSPITRPRGGISSRGPRGRGGRGGFGRRDDRQVTTGASGPFALGSITSGHSQKIAVERGSSGKYHRFRDRTDSCRRASGEAPQPKIEKVEEYPANDAEYSSSSTDSEGPRMDVEYISLLDNAKSEDEGGDREMESAWGAGAPVRVPRSAHIDRTAQVNTESSSTRRLRSDLSRKGKEVIFEELVKVKCEPLEDQSAIPPDASMSSEPPKSKTAKAKSSCSKKDALQNESRRPGSRRNKLSISNVEDMEENEREELDRTITLKELARGFPDFSTENEGDTGMDGVYSDTENQTFVFQFPNIFPQLLPAINTEAKVEGNETNVGTGSPGTEETHNPPKTPTVPQLYKQPKLSMKAQHTLLESYPPSGIAGKLRIHRSGRMTMLWGVPGHSDEDNPIEMDVARGTLCEFLQEAVVMKQQSPWGDQDIDERGRRKGVAFSLGQVKGKFVVSPDFEMLLNADKKKGKGRGNRKARGKETAEV